MIYLWLIAGIMLGGIQRSTEAMESIVVIEAPTLHTTLLHYPRRETQGYLSPIAEESAEDEIGSFIDSPLEVSGSSDAGSTFLSIDSPLHEILHNEEEYVETARYQQCMQHYREHIALRARMLKNYMVHHRETIVAGSIVLALGGAWTYYILLLTQVISSQ